MLTHHALAERPLNELPMYGGQHHPETDRNPAFSRDAVQRAWKAFYGGDFDTAIKRFNQGWMFDNENPEVYWGFGLIMGQRSSHENPEENLKESVRFLEMANEKDPENGRIIGDLAFSHTILGHYYKSESHNDAAAQRHFRTAGKLFDEAYRINPKYPLIVANWSLFYFYTGDFQRAKVKADEAEKLGYRFDGEYIRELERKLK